MLKKKGTNSHRYEIAQYVFKNMVTTILMW